VPSRWTRLCRPHLVSVANSRAPLCDRCEHMSRSAPIGRPVRLLDTPIGGNLANRGMGPATTTGTGPAPGPYPGDATGPAMTALPAFASSTAPDLPTG
jgi:hypothetical protein